MQTHHLDGSKQYFGSGSTCGVTPVPRYRQGTKPFLLSALHEDAGKGLAVAERQDGPQDRDNKCEWQSSSQ